ncbi:MAG: hypothetical protein ACKO92_05985 [Actinomycetota bacterium]
MLADVVESAQMVLAIANNQDAFVADFGDYSVADLAQVLGQPGEAPVGGENRPHLATKNIGGNIFFAGETLAQAVDFGHFVHPKPVGISS